MRPTRDLATQLQAALNDAASCRQDAQAYASELAALRNECEWRKRTGTRAQADAQAAREAQVGGWESWGGGGGHS